MISDAAAALLFSFGPGWVETPFGHTVLRQLFRDRVLEQIANADEEEVQLSRALLRSIGDKVSLNFSDGFGPDDWEVTGPPFQNNS